MKAFERKMSEQVALVTTLVMDINGISNDVQLDVEYTARFKRLTVRINNPDQKVISKDIGDIRVFYIMHIETFLSPRDQECPFQDCCTIEQMVDVLHQILQALIEGRSHENTEHHSATDSEHTATTQLDQRNGIDGAFLTSSASLCHGSIERTGGQPAGAVSQTV